MALTRPAYSLTVENMDNPWTATVAEGDSYDPDAGVWLADGATLEWRFVEAPPAQLEPEVAQFAILADTMANLPTFDLGDRVRVTLTRPAADPDPDIVYMDFAGRITDSELTSEAKTGRLLLVLTAVDPTSELTHDVSFGGFIAGLSPTAAWPAFIYDHYDAGIYVYYVAEGIDPMIDPPRERWWDASDVTIGNTSGVPVTVAAPELIAKVLPPTLAAPSGGGFAVQRYVVDTITESPIPGWDGTDIEPDHWKFFLAQWLPEPAAGTVPTIFVYQFSATDADRVTIERTTDPVAPGGALIAVNACYMPDGAEWTRDRTTAPNRIIVTGQNASTGQDAAPFTVEDTDALTRYGAITREVDTFALSTGLAAIAAAYLDVMATNAAENWQLKETTILTDKMDDATLDAYAPLFWTPREPVPGVMGTPILLYGVAEDVDPTGGYLFAHLAGVTFEITDGELTITPELVPAKAPALGGLTSAAPSYDDFGASAFGNATYHDQGGATPYMDPTLTYEAAKLASL